MSTIWQDAVTRLAPPVVGSTRAVCPVCNGGTDGEKCMTISRRTNGEVSARCFRSKCGFRLGNPPSEYERSLSPPEPRYYTRPTTNLTHHQADIIFQRFGLEPGTVASYSPTDDRFVLPVYGWPTRRVRGKVAVSLSGATPKVLQYNELPEEPFIHYATPVGRLDKLKIVIVEDWFSAEKVADAGGMGVAILGTTLSEDMVNELALLLIPTAIALDRDAFGVSLAYHRKFKERFKHLEVWRLKQDLKYESTERIARALEGEVDFFGEVNSGGHAQIEERI